MERDRSGCHSGSGRSPRTRAPLFHRRSSSRECCFVDDEFGLDGRRGHNRSAASAGRTDRCEYRHGLRHTRLRHAGGHLQRVHDLQTELPGQDQSQVCRLRQEEIILWLRGTKPLRLHEWMWRRSRWLLHAVALRCGSDRNSSNGNRSSDGHAEGYAQRNAQTRHPSRDPEAGCGRESDHADLWPTYRYQPVLTHHKSDYSYLYAADCSIRAVGSCLFSAGLADSPFFHPIVH